jgi:transcriptional regulator with GAF, ATPase, and Fis domain
MADYATMPNSPLPTLDDAKRKLIHEALKLTGGKKMAAAKILNVERRKLNRLIEKLNISVTNLKD